MKRLRFLLIISIFLALTLRCQAQKLSPQAQISILTVSPGDEIYTKFGHSAIRVFDPNLHIDWVYNYGTFDFNTPHFYLNFIKGRLNYMLSVQTFRGFQWVYSGENRWVDEQILNLTQQQKQRVFNFLRWNSMPANKYYLYEFFFDNCATRVRDVFFNTLKDTLIFENKQLKITYRQAFNAYMKSDPWLLFGENFIVGSIADKKLTAWDAMFLPDYLEKYFDQIKIKTGSGVENVVLKKVRLIDAKRPQPKFPWYSPFIIFSLLALILFYVGYQEIKKNKRQVWIDFILFFILGLAGVVLLGLWFFTDHIEGKNNFNLLWAFPLHLIFAFFVLKRQVKPFVAAYSQFFFWFTILLFVIYSFGFITNLWIIPQRVDYGVLPLLIIIASRFYIVYKTANK